MEPKLITKTFYLGFDGTEFTTKEAAQKYNDLQKLDSNLIIVDPRGERLTKMPERGMNQNLVRCKSPEAFQQFVNIVKYFNETPPREFYGWNTYFYDYGKGEWVCAERYLEWLDKIMTKVDEVDK